MLCDFNDGHYDTLKQRQQWTDKHDTSVDSTITPIRLTVAVQSEASGSLMHGTVAEPGTHELNKR